MIEVRRIERKGRGVVACERIAAGDLLEAAPTIELTPPDTDTIARTALDDYYFAHPGNPDGGLLVLGLASLCNHSSAANVATIVRRDDAVGWIVELRAVRDIAPGEEITRRYACEPWFAEAV